MFVVLLWSERLKAWQRLTAARQAAPKLKRPEKKRTGHHGAPFPFDSKISRIGSCHFCIFHVFFPFCAAFFGRENTCAMWEQHDAKFEALNEALAETCGNLQISYMSAVSQLKSIRIQRFQRVDFFNLASDVFKQPCQRTRLGTF